MTADKVGMTKADQMHRLQGKKMSLRNSLRKQT